jgi:hypothetical protein
MIAWSSMVMASPRLSANFDLLVFDVDGFPVLAVEVKGWPGRKDDAKQQLREQARKLGIPYGLVVDPETAEFLDLTGPTGPPLLAIPTHELLAAYAHGLDSSEVSGQYLELLVDTWLRNIMQPLPDDPPPGFSQLATLGLATKLREGRKVTEARRFF